MDYYNYLNNKKNTGKLFGLIPYPEIEEIHFFYLTLIISSGLVYILPFHIYIPILFGILNLEFASVYSLREDIIIQCEAMESLFENDFRTRGIDIDFPDDPLHITKSDRDFIFDDIYYPTVRKKSLISYKVKTFRKVFFKMLLLHVPFIVLWHLFVISILT